MISNTFLGLQNNYETGKEFDACQLSWPLLILVFLYHCCFPYNGYPTTLESQYEYSWTQCSVFAYVIYQNLKIQTFNTGSTELQSTLLVNL